MSPTIRDIALECGVSTATVSLALQNNSRISDKRKKEILSVANRIGYQPNAIAKSLRGGKTHSIGILWSLGAAKSIHIIREITFRMMELGYVSYIADSLGDSKIIKSCLQDYAARNIDGLIIFEPEDHLYYPGILTNLEKISNVVIVSRTGVSEGFPFDFIIDSRRLVMQKIIDHLLATGRKKICLVANPYFAEREEEFKNLLAENGILTDNYRIYNSGDYYSISANVISQLKANHGAYDAIMTGNDETAAAVINCLVNECGVRVPEDIAVIGTEESLMSKHFHIPIATTKVCAQKFATLAVEMLMEQIDKKRKSPRIETLAQEFVVRRSVGEIARTP